MTSPKLTWNTPRWSSCNEVKQFPYLQLRYGNAVHAAVEFAHYRIADDLDQPLAPDVKHSLRRVAETGFRADLAGLGRDASAALYLQAHRRYRVAGFDSLTDAQLRECALAAAEAFAAGCGAPSTEAHAVRMVRSLLEAWEGGVRDAELGRLRLRAQKSGGRRYADGGKTLTPEEKVQLGQARKRLLKSCLRAAGLGSGDSNVERLITAAIAAGPVAPLHAVTFFLG